MNNRTETLLSTYRPELAVVVYKSKVDTEDYYLESHGINDNGGLTEGKPLLQQTMQGIVDVFFDERKNISQVKGIIPENLLAYELLPGGNVRMVWYRPAEIRVVHFADHLKLKTTKVWVPAMLYVAERDLSVFALKANTRPIANTKLLKAPFFNVNSSGVVCLGSAHVKKPTERTYISLMKYWEDLFWLSEFTHLNDDNKTRSKLENVWKKIVSSKTKLRWSEINELVPVNNKATLKSIIKC